MGVFAYSVTKNTQWRGDTQGFSNLYHYELDSDEPSEQVLSDMIDIIVAAEKLVHGSAVTFDIARVWGPVNPNGSGGRMRLVKDLSGNGSQVSTATWYREFAYLCVFPLGRYGSKNRPQFLRKWIRPCTTLGGGTNITSGTDKITPEPTSLTNYMNAIRSVAQGAGGAPTSLCNASGEHKADDFHLYDYLEHRQFG